MGKKFWEEVEAKTLKQKEKLNQLKSTPEIAAAQELTNELIIKNKDMIKKYN